MLHKTRLAPRFLLAAVILILFASVCAGREDRPGKAKRPPTVVTVRVDDVAYTLKDNDVKSKVAKDFRNSLMDFIENPDAELCLQIDDPSSGSQSGDITTQAISVWKYWADIRWEYGYVPGCVHAFAWHLNLHLRDTWANRELVNIHLAVWWQNGPQFGIYNSGASQFCAQSRGTFTNIKNAIYGYFRYSVGLPSWVASSLAYSAAVVVVTAFALSWA
jgi:hypothetical protein